MFLIIDSSVALKWYLKTEEYRNQAQSLLGQYIEGELEFIMPELWLYEMVNAFRSNVKSKKITTKLAKRYINEVMDLNPILVNFSSIMEESFNLANKLDISVYDASYIALAKKQKYPFYTADQKLLDKIPPSFKNIHHIKSFDTRKNLS